MKASEQLKKYIKEMIKAQLQETSTSAGAGPYMTPYAFQGSGKKRKSRRELIAQMIGFKIVDPNHNSDSVPDPAVSESDQMYTPIQQVGRSIRYINQQIDEIREALSITSQIKTENKIETKQFWKRSQKALHKLESKLIKLSSEIRELRG